MVALLCVLALALAIFAGIGWAKALKRDGPIPPTTEETFTVEPEPSSEAPSSSGVTTTESRTKEAITESKSSITAVPITTQRTTTTKKSAVTDSFVKPITKEYKRMLVQYAYDYAKSIGWKSVAFEELEQNNYGGHTETGFIHLGSEYSPTIEAMDKGDIRDAIDFLDYYKQFGHDVFFAHLDDDEKTIYLGAAYYYD